MQIPIQILSESTAKAGSLVGRATAASEKDRVADGGAVGAGAKRSPSAGARVGLRQVKSGVQRIFFL